MQASRLSDEACRGIVEGTTDLVIVFDVLGEIQFVNDAVPEALGGRRADHIGRNLIDYVHPDDLERALQTLDFSSRLGSVPGSTTFRTRAADGGFVTIEVSTGRPLPGDAGHRFALGRTVTHHVAVEKILRGLVEGVDVPAAMAAVVDVIGWEGVGSMVVIDWCDRDGTHQQVSSGAPPILALGDPATGSPWSAARRTREAVLALDLDALAPDIRRAARELELCAYWVQPVDAPVEPALLTVWTREGGPPPTLHTEGVLAAMDLIAVILRWEEQQRQLDHAASHDPLTGLGNRRAFFATLGRTRGGAVLYGDLDGFKPINDRLGHAAGDEVLSIVAARLQASVREGDFVARLGGDEFGVVCPGAALADAVSIAARIEAMVAEPMAIGGDEVRVGISVGIAHSTEPLQESDVEAADRALYERKRVTDR